MKLMEVRTVIRDRIIGLGYEEWTGSLDTDNVPDTIVEKSFHVKVTGGTGASLNMHVLKVQNDVVLTLWRKGFRDSVVALDAGLASIQDVLCDLLSPAVRTLPAYRKIDLSSYSLEPIAVDNDAFCKIIINLTVEVIVEVTQPI